MESIITIITKNYLAFARTLANSYKEHHPNGHMFVLIADHVDDFFDPYAENFTPILLDELRHEVKHLDQMLFKYSVVELCTALKPFVLKHILNKYQFKEIAYIDPDILVMDTLDPLSELLKEHNIVLTPHILKPYGDNKQPTELRILQAGSFNLGFIALANRPASLAMLEWWKEKLYNQCIMDQDGLFVDQKWVDLVPGLFEGTYILRHPGYNAAYWNLHDREITQAKNTYFCNGETLRFFHFSGYDIENPNEISKWQNRHLLEELPALKTLFQTYRKLLNNNKHTAIKHWPYAFNLFHGEHIPISNFLKRIYLNTPNNERFGNTFEEIKNQFTHYLLSSDDNKLPPVLSILFEAQRRSDQQHILTGLVKILRLDLMPGMLLAKDQPKKLTNFIKKVYSLVHPSESQ
ncbi:MAG: glycosyl transferase [Gammaproteobacteria bacterium]